MATLYPQVILQLFDNYGVVLAGGKIYSYEGGTTTPLVTYQDLNGATPNANPVVLDAAGRATVRITEGVSYKFVVKDSADVTIATYDHIIEGESAAASDNVYLIHLTFAGNPGAQAFMGGAAITHANTLPIDFDGASAEVQTAPGATYTISVKKNDVEVGTIAFDTSGTPTFATTGGATVSLVYGDKITFIAPDSGTATDIMATLVGDLA